MSNYDYEQAANDLRVWLEDYRKAKMESIEDLEDVLEVALFNRYFKRLSYGTFARDMSEDDARSIVSNLDTLRPVLESWWANESN